MNKLIPALAVALLAFGSISCTKTTEKKADKEETTEAATTVEQKDAVVELSDDALYRPDKAVDRLTILDFNAEWCGPCKKFRPVFDEIAAKYADRVDFVSVNIDNNPQTAEAFGVNGIPHVAFIKTDGTIDSFVGLDDLMPAEAFEALITARL